MSATLFHFRRQGLPYRDVPATTFEDGTQVLVRWPCAPASLFIGIWLGGRRRGEIRQNEWSKDRRGDAPARLISTNPKALAINKSMISPSLTEAFQFSNSSTPGRDEPRPFGQSEKDTREEPLDLRPRCAVRPPHPSKDKNARVLRRCLRSSSSTSPHPVFR